MRVALFVACFNDALFPGTGRAVTRLLERLGHEVVFPPAQSCCGQVHWTTGYHREAADLARGFVRAFGGASAGGAVVTPSASCAATVRESYPRIARAAGDAGLARAAAGLAVYELSEFLVDVLGVTDVGARFPHRVAYHPTCHSLRPGGAGDRPLRLLRAVRDLELVDLPEAGECCGFGGAFAMKNADVSVAMVADKVRHVRATAADVVCAVDNSCLAHLGGALSRLRAGVRTAHLAEILAGTGPA
ncbi:(Fe-S)-binding protein [Actinomadura kijaniata]|uniref:L-lactate dehydrogenase complex protein LldE n=1 Tax=Actinomadura namibiensis TaxID=182080 RepID=A0A7W3LRE5_ACTNM|nr:(Fe-S)-binding protein [Actinomadura namibiensis]MBA8952815.1 L-lactate dehydrogenase complex protein LldE [Actinomadura namibiensis]